MGISKLVNTLVISATIGVFGPVAMAHVDDGSIIGRVAHGGDDTAVRVCFNDDMTVKSGEKYAVIRHTLRPTSPKAVATLESTRVGVLRIATPADGRCATAVVLSGSAKWLDWVSTGAGS